eukprot:2246401-Prymnesium_polylepis.1
MRWPSGASARLDGVDRIDADVLVYPCKRARYHVWWTVGTGMSHSVRIVAMQCWCLLDNYRVIFGNGNGDADCGAQQPCRA